jgi:predicted nucleic acid-binding protein
VEEDVRFVTPVFTIGEYWRVSTESKGLGHPPALADRFLREWIAVAPLVGPRGEFLETFLTTVAARAPRGAEVFDYQIAATCVVNDVDELWTFDQAFPRLDGLLVRDPTA